MSLNGKALVPIIKWVLSQNKWIPNYLFLQREKEKKNLSSSFSHDVRRDLKLSFS